MNCETVLRLLLTGSEIVSFEYWSEFALRLQRDETLPDDAAATVFSGVRIPTLFGLRLHGPWWTGKRHEWKQQVEAFPVSPAAGLPAEATLQASTILHLMGPTITGVELQEPGDLTLHFSNGEVLHIAGTGTESEESWLLELAPDDPDQENWWIVCDNKGDLFGKWPDVE